MKDSVQNDLKKLCQHIIESNDPESLIEQLTLVQMLYERLLVLNYLEENEDISTEREVEGIKKQIPQLGLDDFVPKTEMPEKAEDDKETIEPEKPEPVFAITPETPIKEQKQEEPQIRSDKEKEIKPKPIQESVVETLAKEEKEEHKTETQEPSDLSQEGSKIASLNARLGKGIIEVGLNDRIAFVKHLFEGKQEDFNRVLSQLNTFQTYQETTDFMANFVKPEYNWEDKEEYEERLLGLIKKRFGEE